MQICDQGLDVWVRVRHSKKAGCACVFGHCAVSIFVSHQILPLPLRNGRLILISHGQDPGRCGDRGMETRVR
jgi:hypothetical protein